MKTFEKASVRSIVLLATSLIAFSAFAQRATIGGGWTYDPSIDGMKSLRDMKPIEGCNIPGGLQRVTSSDEPGKSTQFWCGSPPFCLTDAATPLAEQCTILPFTRRDPRYDPNGKPGVNGVRDPDDLVCTNMGLPPINGRCPLPPTVSATLNGQQNLTAQVGTTVTLSVRSPGASQLRKSCSGANFGFTPFVEDNLDSIAAQTGTVGPGTSMNVGATNCTLTATNPRGSASTTVSYNATAVPTPPPVVVVEPPITGGGGDGSGDGGGETVIQVQEPTYHFQFCIPYGSNGGAGGGGCSPTDFYPSVPNSSCSRISAKSAKGYAAAYSALVESTGYTDNLKSLDSRAWKCGN